MRSFTILLLVFVFRSISSSVSAQSVALSEVDNLMNQQRFDEASLLCEQLIYGHPGDINLMAESLLKKSECLKRSGKHATIPFLLGRLDGLSLNDSIRSRVCFQKALAYYLSDNFEMAEKSVLPVFNLPYAQRELVITGAILYAMALGESGKWLEARLFLCNFIRNDLRADTTLKRELTAEVESLYSDENIPRLKSIKKAKVLSLIFPGLGQAYNGNYGKGLLNLLFVSGSGAWATWNILNGTYITAATAGVYILLYFYFGGANQSSWLVPVKNQKKKSQFNQQLKPELSKLGGRMCMY